MTNNTRLDSRQSIARRLCALTLLAALAITGGMTSNQPDQAPSAGDPKPRCC